MNEWAQVNVALSRTSAPALDNARRVFDAVNPVLDQCRTDGRLQRFHFMRKPPDIRLRVEGPSPHADIVPPIETLLRRLTEEGHVSDFFTSVYEPETRLFGGPESMSLVHDFFDADSRAWLEHDRLQRTSSTRIPVATLTTAIINELFALTLEDRAEVWDTWCNVAELVGDATAEPGEGMAPPQYREGPEHIAVPAELEVLSRYHAANSRLATGLRGLWRAGQLQCGLRGLLPFVAVFHFHRYGLDRRAQSVQAMAMRRASDPRRGMKGAE